jgi:uncharacterized protein with beta-barrel porin domain
MKNKTIFYTFLFLTTLSPFQSNASDIVISDSKLSQSFTQNNQNLTITDTGNINGSVTSSYLGSTITINASGTNGINSGSSTSIRDVETINFNSGRIRSTNPFAIINSKNSDFTINIGKSATLSGNNFGIFDSNPNSGKSFNLNNDGVISAIYPILVRGSNLNLINTGTITSNNNSTLISYLVASDPNMIQNIVNEASGIMNGNIYTFAKDNALVTNRGVINGNIQVSGSNKSIQIINDGGLIGSSSSVKFISLNTGDKSSFKLINGTVNANMEVGLNAGNKATDNGNLLGVKQVVDLKGGIYNGNIEFITGATINLGATDFKGTIKSKYFSGYSLDKGSINVISNANLDSDIDLGGNNGVSYVLIKSDDGNAADVTYSGAKIKSDYLNIEQGSRLNLDSDMNIEGLISANISGTLNFGYNSRSFVGNVISKGTGIIDLKSGNHNIIGDLTLNSGDILKVEVGSNSVGKLTVNGIANIPLGVKLDLNVTSASTLDKSYSTVIVDGNNGSSIKNITNNNIDITSIDISSYRLVTYNTSVSDDGTDLLLNVSSTSLEQSIENDPKNQFSSLKPQDKSSIKVNSLVTIDTNNSLIEKRISTNHISYLRSYSSRKDTPNINQNKKYRLGFSTGDSERNLEVWTRVFGTKAKQKNISNNGYNSNTAGFAIGVDKKISKDTMIGFTLSNASSKISTTNSDKITNVESYQANFYASRFFDKYFFSAIIGVALNKNESNRLILDTSSIANAKYNSYNYVSRLGIGAIYKNVAKSGFNISPELSTTFVNTKNNSYFENGAENFNLAVRKNYDEYLEARFGAEVSYKNIKMKNLSNLLGKKIYFTPKFNASYGYNLLNKKQITVSNFIGQSTTFNTISTNIDPVSIRMGTSLLLSNLDDVTIIFDYVNERRGTYISHSAGFKASYQF